MTERSGSERAELLEERAELVAANEAATSWGAAVGARLERIMAIDRTLAATAERADLVALDPLEMLLDAARYAEGNGGSGSNPAWAKAARAAVAKARLAAQDQKPFGWLGKEDVKLASMDALNALADLTDAFLSRHGCFPSDQTNDKERHWRRAMERAYELVGQPSTPDREAKLAKALPDHGGADAGVGEYLARPSCRCFDERSRELCLDKDRCRPIATALSKPAPAAGSNASAEATYNIGRWLSAALEDPNACEEFKHDIRAWMEAGKPNVQLSDASAEARLREALEPFASYQMVAVGFNGALTKDDLKECTWVAGFTGPQPEFRHFETAREALSAHPHASDCEKQGETTKSEGGSDAARAADRQSFAGGVQIPLDDRTQPEVAPGPSDRTADVTVDELAHWLLHNLSLDAHPLKDARALLDAFTVGRR